jgi:hypothetical protein
MTDEKQVVNDQLVMQILHAKERIINCLAAREGANLLDQSVRNRFELEFDTLVDQFEEEEIGTETEDESEEAHSSAMDDELNSLLFGYFSLIDSMDEFSYVEWHYLRSEKIMRRLSFSTKIPSIRKAADDLTRAIKEFQANKRGD